MGDNTFKCLNSYPEGLLPLTDFHSSLLLSTVFTTQIPYEVSGPVRIIKNRISGLQTRDISLQLQNKSIGIEGLQY